MMENLSCKNHKIVVYHKLKHLDDVTFRVFAFVVTSVPSQNLILQDPIPDICICGYCFLKMEEIQIKLASMLSVSLKASGHSFKQFTSRLLKLTFSLSLCTYISRMDVMLDFICMGPVDLPGSRRKRQNTK